MDRRNFLKMSGLGATGLFLQTSLAAAPLTRQWKAEELVHKALDLALKQGALYADARIGTCEILGHSSEFKAVSLFNAELLGMRICTPQGWRHLVLRELDSITLETHIQHAHNALPTVPRTGAWWVSAEFCSEKVLARKSSHPDTETQLNASWMRYVDRPKLPINTDHLLFCDLLLEQ